MLESLKSFWQTISLMHKTSATSLWSLWLETLEEISWSDVTSGLWNDCKFRTGGLGWSFLNCCMRNAEWCCCWCSYRKQNKNSSDSELDFFFKAVLKTQIGKWLKWGLTFFPLMYSYIYYGFFLFFNCIVGYLHGKVYTISNMRTAGVCSKTSWTLLSKLIWIGYDIFKCSCESEKGVRINWDHIFWNRFLVVRFQCNSCFSFTLSWECLPKK